VKAEFEPAAEQELIESIQRYLVEAGPPQADGFDNEVRRVVDLLLVLPKLGTPGGRGTRAIPLRRYPYSLHYRLERDMIRILAVAHHSRRPGYWAKRG
jgi:plasmid stabilization system protein ParE